jgi:serine protease Do
MTPISSPSHRRLTALVAAGGLALAGLALAGDLAKDNPKGPFVTVPLDETSIPRDGLPRGSFAPIVKSVAPAVVKIEMTTTINREAIGLVPGGPFGQLLPQQQIIPQTEHGLGSGVIVTKDGYILTNNHVVDGAKELKVTLQDGREFKAKVIGRDPKSDIAVIKIAADNLPVVTMADSEKVQVGDVVLAIGNPFGVGQTVTSGIVSATDRGNMGIEDYENFIQTDAAINPGNSGGALVDINGRVIGINTAIMSRSGGSQGVGFAIPSDLARTVMTSLVKDGQVTRGYLGVMIQNVTPELASQFNLKDTQGALIGDVVPDGPAAKAGFSAGDVVLSFNGHPVTDSRHLRLEVAETQPGTSVPVEILRNGEQKKLEVTVKPIPGSDEVASAGSGNDQDTGTLNGVGVGDLDQAARDQFHVPAEVKGAIVTDVDRSSPAAEAGLKPGMVIEEINRHPVKNADEAVQLTAKATSKQTLVRIWENGGSRYVVVDESNTKAG